MTFQSTLPYGSDCLKSTPARYPCNFNPRSLTGATKSEDNSTTFVAEFQSTLPYGSDRLNRASQTKKFKFQSTLPYGSDNGGIRRKSNDSNFNPRSLTGATVNAVGKDCLITISIHAPLRERQLLPFLRIITLVFQSTLPYGSDGIKQAGSSSRMNFNPRSLTGATQKFATLPTLSDISIHAPLRERHKRPPKRRPIN